MLACHSVISKSGSVLHLHALLSQMHIRHTSLSTATVAYILAAGPLNGSYPFNCCETQMQELTADNMLCRCGSTLLKTAAQR